MLVLQWLINTAAEVFLGKFHENLPLSPDVLNMFLPVDILFAQTFEGKELFWPLVFHKLDFPERSLPQ